MHIDKPPSQTHVVTSLEAEMSTVPKPMLDDHGGAPGKSLMLWHRHFCHVNSGMLIHMHNHDKLKACNFPVKMRHLNDARDVCLVRMHVNHFLNNVHCLGPRNQESFGIAMFVDL
jgi:hypothetical protein